MTSPVPRSASRIIATSVGLMLLVSTVVGVLGWRLLSQESALVHQQARDGLERTADQMVTKFLRRLEALEAWLSEKGRLTEGDLPNTRNSGAIVARFADTRVDIVPPVGLLYYPTAAPSSAIAPSIFAEAERLEFKTRELDVAASVLAALAKSDDPRVSAEAMLRLGRVQGKRGQLAEALSSYDRLSRLTDALDPARDGGVFVIGRGYLSFPDFFVAGLDPEVRRRIENALATQGRRAYPLSDSAGVPYRLLSQFARCQLLASSGREEEAREEARRLVSEISSGRWRLDKASFFLYDSSSRKLAGLVPPPPAQLALAEQLEEIWDDWQVFQRSSSRSLIRRIHKSGDTPLITLLNANRQRLYALIADGNSVRSLGLDLDAAGENVRASVVDEQGRVVLGHALEPAELEVDRSLSAAGLPWRLRLAASNAEAKALFRGRRNYFLGAFSVFVLLVAVACYAIARGALREATAGRLQGEFVSAVSHEFRSPLTALRQLTELLAQGRVQDESRRRVYFDVLMKETSRLHRLVEDLLDFGRMDAGGQQYRFETLDLSELVRDAVEEYQSEAGANGHTIELAAAANTLKVSADREALKRVVRNLLENAVKYSPDAPTVWVETLSSGLRAGLRVRDEGIGVAPAEQSRIFDKFVRGEAAKKACIQGTGIGLSMVKEIVQTHHGEIDIMSEVGRGSTFAVWLPLSDTGEGRRL